MRKHIGKALVLVLVIAAFGLAGNEDRTAYQSIEETKEEVKVAQQQQAIEATYVKPAAFRLQSPTADQMDHVEHLVAIQQVVK